AVEFTDPARIAWTAPRIRFECFAACASRPDVRHEWGEGRAWRRSHPRRRGGVYRHSWEGRRTKAAGRPAETQTPWLRKSDRCHAGRGPRARALPGVRAIASAYRQSAASNV